MKADRCEWNEHDWRIINSRIVGQAIQVSKACLKCHATCRETKPVRVPRPTWTAREVEK